MYLLNEEVGGLKCITEIGSRMNDNININSGNGLSPNRRQTITWSYGYPVHLRIYTSSDLN